MGSFLETYNDLILLLLVTFKFEDKNNYNYKDERKRVKEGDNWTEIMNIHSDFYFSIDRVRYAYFLTDNITHHWPR